MQAEAAAREAAEAEARRQREEQARVEVRRRWAVAKERHAPDLVTTPHCVMAWGIQHMVQPLPTDSASNPHSPTEGAPGAACIQVCGRRAEAALCSMAGLCS